MTVIEKDAIYQAVREHYGAKARETSNSCCGSAKKNDPNATRLYAPEQLAGIPDGLADLSLGCGNPVGSIDIRPGDTVMDLGSGGGLDCFLAAKRVGPSGRVIGIDMTSEMIEKAMANAAKVGATNVEFRPGQIESIPIGDGEVDVIMSNCVINLSPDKPAVFREMFRVLRSGGRVSVSDIVTRGTMNPLVSKGLEQWAGCIAGALDVKDYREGLQAAGFTDIHIQRSNNDFITRVGELPIGLPFSAWITAKKPVS